MISEENPFRANERLREERLRRGWSQQKLADQLGIAVVTVNRWERGKQQPTSYYRMKLSALFEKSVEELGLTEEITDPVAVNSIEEVAKGTEETLETSDTMQETLLREPSLAHDMLFYTPSLEREKPRLSSSSPYARFNKLLFHGKRRALFLLLIAALLIVIAPIAFSLVHSHAAKYSSMPKKTSSPLIATSTAPTQSLWQQVLHDPLTSSGGGTRWGNNDMDQSNGCHFNQGALQMITTGPDYCSADFMQFHNVRFRIDMTIQQGPRAGITLRTYGEDSDMYYFSINVNGQYEVDALMPKEHFPRVLLRENSSAIHPGPDKVNTLLAEVNGSQLSFWINGQQVGQISAPPLQDGYVAICGGAYDLEPHLGLAMVRLRWGSIDACMLK